MRPMIRFMRSLATAGACAAALSAVPVFAASAEPGVSPDLEVRFCPAERIHPWPAAGSRQLSSLLLQNVAIVNRGTTPATVESVSIELLSHGAVADARHFDASALTRIGAQGPALQSAGMLKQFAFQFCGDALIGPGITLANGTLAPSQALLIAHQAFLYPGARDTLRVRAQVLVDATRKTVEETLPIDALPAAVPLAFPLRGAWYVAAGASFHTAHRWAVPEEFALDLLRIGGNAATHSGDGTRFEDYYAYGVEVLAAAAGRVVGAHDGEPEDPRAMRQPGESADAYFARLLNDQTARLAAGTPAILGNFVSLQHADGTYSHYAHLKPGSVRVRAGDSVHVGQPLGLLGSSGNSTEPHLHFQVCDRADALLCAGRPVVFSNVTLPLSDEPRQLQSGDHVVAN